MLLDLVRALLAAVLVGVLPGYFWACVLSASSDLAERLALSPALSVTLVPATILVPARIFGTGLTLPNRGRVEYWKRFEVYPDLYRIAFQNRDVVILEPRF